MDKQTGRQIDEPTDKWTDRQIDERKDRQQMNGRTLLDNLEKKRRNKQA